MRQKEANLHRRIQLAVRKKYPLAWACKISDRFRRFIPDLLIVVPTRFQPGSSPSLFVEVKTPEGRLSEGQKEEHKKIRAAGGHVLVSSEVAEVLAWLEKKGAW